jgi:hypothetical protein
MKNLKIGIGILLCFGLIITIIKEVPNFKNIPSSGIIGELVGFGLIAWLIYYLFSSSSNNSK